MLAFARTPPWWCLAQIAGWLLVPVMNACMDVILRSTIPAGLQGRVYACRNTLQFFTLPVGTLAGGALVDKVCVPLAGAAGPALAMGLVGLAGVVICLAFRRLLGRYTYKE